MSGVVNERQWARAAARSRGVDVVTKGKPTEPLPDGQEDTPRDRWFNPHRYPCSKAAQALIHEIIGMIQNYEGHFKLRQRARKMVDQKTFEATITAVISDLMHHHFTGHAGGVVITRSNTILGCRSRYRPPAYGKTLPAILDKLKAPEMEFVKQVMGGDDDFDKTRSTTLYPSDRLINRIKEYGVTADDLGLHDTQEVIVLKRTKADYWDDGGYEEYEDTNLTHQYRAEMQRINRFLQDAPLDFDKSVLKKDKHADINDRQLRRVFTKGRFDCGGRLFGGFWQPLSKKERLEGLSINGDSVVCLDFSQMGLRIAYGLAKATPPVGYGYRLPGLETSREAIKKLINAALFRDKPLTRLPKGLKALLPEGIGLPQAMELITQIHPELVPLFFTGVGHTVQFIESKIIVDVVLKAFEQDITALPVHDAIVVAEYDAEEAEALMRDIFMKHTGVPGDVKREEPKECFIC